MEKILGFLKILVDLGGNLDAIAGWMIIITVIKFWLGNRKVVLRFSCGSIRMKKSDVNCASVTNIVSERFFGGDRIPPEVRDEIIKKTSPWYEVVSSEEKK